MTDRAAETVVTILGDSRVFDTYYTNDSYQERYGYNATFPFLLAKEVCRNGGDQDVVHIPEHFRGGTIENNIIRLALTDPTLVVLCDGIWETLVNEHWLIDGQRIDLKSNSRLLADRFIANEFAVSPRSYAEKQRRLISYFRRRRRQCVWMSLPMPPRTHLDRLHYAGNLRCIPEWDECLAAVNDAVRPIVSAYRATFLDLHELALSTGGFGQALIDQWHFSKAFHVAIAKALYAIVDGEAHSALPVSHASRRFMLPRRLDNESVCVIGTPQRISSWRAENAVASIEAVSEGFDGDGLDRVARSASPCVVLVDGPELAPEVEAALLIRIPDDKILLYPAELGPIHNPVGADKAQHSVLR
jgi:hypothetical protein